MDIVFYVVLAAAWLLGPWILVWRSHVKFRRAREEDRARFGELTRRLYLLENEVQTLRDGAGVTTIPPTVPTGVIDPVVEHVPEVVPAVPAEEGQPVQIPAEAWVTATPLHDIPAHEPATTAPLPTTNSPAPARTLVDRFKSALDVEEKLGTNWLNKVGIVLLVLGFAFLISTTLKTLGPAGKVLVGALLSVALLGAGIWFERHDRYRILARAGVGGGWALLFFTTYAMYHVPAAKVLSSPVADLLLMLVVAAAMVWHTLRYRSQVVTGLAFLLAFLTVTVSHSDVYSLMAGGVLAAGLVAIVGRMQWFELEVVGILASYFNHYLWLRPIIEPMQGHRRPFPEFVASAAILLLYWAIFRASYVWRRPVTARQEHVSTAAALLNTSLLMALFKYQSSHPEWAFWALLAIGSVETLLGQLPVTRRRRSAVVVLSTIGIVLLVAAFPFRYSGTRLSVLWLMEAEAILLIGVWTREVIFRRLGLLASAVVAGQMICFDAAAIAGRRMDGADVHSDFRAALMFLVAAVVFYGNAHWLTRRWRDLFSSDIDKRLFVPLSYVAAVMAAMGAWAAYPEAWTAVAWCALAFSLSLAGYRFRIAALGYQGNALTWIAVMRALAVNLNDTGHYNGLSLRLVTLLLVSALVYANSRWSWPGESGDREVGFAWHAAPLRAWMGGAYTWAASFLLALLAWYELRSIGVAVAWMLGGLILAELGVGQKSIALRLQSYLFFLASFTRIFFVNLNGDGNPGEISPRFYTVVPLALAFFYAYWRLHCLNDGLLPLERRLRAAQVHAFLGTITMAALMRFEIDADWVAAAWAALAFVLLAVAWRTAQRTFLHQSLLVVSGVLFRTVLHNFYQRSYFPASGWQDRMLTVGAVVALLFAALPMAFQLREKGESKPGIARWLFSFARRPEQVVFFVAVGLLTVLLALEMHGRVTLSWGIEGVGIFLFALWLGERSFRLAGLGLLLLCVAKIVIVDVWRLDPRDRYLTFIVLGGALLLVSFLYTRNREALRQYL